jgi:hypothetical protein
MKALTVIAIGVFALVAAPVALAGEECCEKAKASNGWCAGCKHGYYDSVELKSEKLYNALRGEPVKGEPKCADCAKALAAGGVCEHCKVAFANQMMYHSMVGYHLARGEHVNAADLKCPNAKKLVASAGGGWCDGCKAGYVGCEKFTDKTAYEQAARARQVLMAASKASEKCEGCAVAMVTDGRCEACRVTFKDGKPKTD